MRSSVPFEEAGAQLAFSTPMNTEGLAVIPTVYAPPAMVTSRLFSFLIELSPHGVNSNMANLDRPEQFAYRSR